MTAPKATAHDHVAGVSINSVAGSDLTSDAEFRAAVREGLADIAAGRTVDLETVEAELRQIIHGKA